MECRTTLTLNTGRSPILHLTETENIFINILNTGLRKRELFLRDLLQDETSFQSTLLNCDLSFSSNSDTDNSLDLTR